MRPVGNIDIAPTIFDFCGVTPPEEMVIDGASLMPLCRGEKVKDWRVAPVALLDGPLEYDQARYLELLDRAAAEVLEGLE